MVFFIVGKEVMKTIVRELRKCSLRLRASVCLFVKILLEAVPIVVTVGILYIEVQHHCEGAKSIHHAPVERNSRS